MKITEVALKFNSTVYLIILFIVVVGYVSYRTLPREASPDVEIPYMLVSTAYPGVSPEDVERLVTNVLERELGGLKGVKVMTSSSAESVSNIFIEFEVGVDLEVAYQKVKDRVDIAEGDLPADVETPVVTELSMSDFPILLINISGRQGADALKKTAEQIQDRIEQVQGVLNVDLSGGLDREIHIYMDPAKMTYYAIGVDQIIARIQQEHRTTPAGSIAIGRSDYSVRIPGEYKDVKLMEEIVVKAPNGNPVHLKDVARVVDGYAERETLSRLDGRESVSLSVKKRAGENIVRIVDEIRAILETEKRVAPEGTKIAILQDQSKTIDSLVSDLENNIISGLILVVGVLCFSMGIRNAVFVALAIPLSMLVSFIALTAMGVTLSMVVLFGLILSLGMLVDNSIVIVENIYRHVSEGEPRLRAAYLATKEVAWPIIASTLTTVLVFVPLLFWPGLMGEFMSYLPITVITVLTASLAVALVINPVLAATFLKAKPKPDDSGAAGNGFIAAYQRVLDWSLGHTKTVLLGTVVVAAIIVGAFIRFDADVEFVPSTAPERAQITVEAPQGTLLDETAGLSAQAERMASSEINVAHAVENVGAEGGDFLSGGGGKHKAVVNLEFKERRDRVGSTWDTVDAIREKVSRLAGAAFRVQLDDDMGPPTGAPVSIELVGENFETLHREAERVKKLIATIPGVVDVRDDYLVGRPEIRIDVDRERAKLRKIDSRAIATTVRAAINGIEASVLREGDEEFDIVVQNEAANRRSIDDILDIRITGEDDVQIPLRDVADVYTTGGLGSVNHVDQKRTVKVTSEVSGRPAAEVVSDVKTLLAASLEMPDGYLLRYTGEDEEQEEAEAFLSKAFGIGVFLIFMVLVTQFNSFSKPLVILGSVGLSMLGVLIGLMATGNNFSVVMTGLGIISLAGIVVNNGIVLIDYANQLMKTAGLSLKAALRTACLVRFRPVLLTAVTTVLGLVPMALGVGVDFTTFQIQTGSQTVEWWGPMAQAVIFGLSFATVFTLVIVPVMYLAQENAKTTIAGTLWRLLPKRRQRIIDENAKVTS